MSRSRSDSSLPPCYARCLPGLEEVAAQEITQELGGNVRKLGRGLVVFRVEAITPRLLKLRTTEDVFLLAWGTDKLTCRAVDLKKIRQWTASTPDWNHLLKLHHGVRPKPKGKPTYHLVTQMFGRHAYFRTSAQKSLTQGLAGKFPSTWKPAEENASIEIWLTIQGKTAYCGLRLSDRTMRHRTWKVEHLPASLRPTVAAAMVRLANPSPHHVFLDPTCGAGTILGERITLQRMRGEEASPVWGGDVNLPTLRKARINLRRLEPTFLARWDVQALPLPTASVDRIASNPPFGKQMSNPEEIKTLYFGMVREMNRVLKPGGLAVLLVSNGELLQRAAGEQAWESQRYFPVEVLGQSAVVTVWRKPYSSGDS